MKKIYFLLFALGCGQLFAQQSANLVLFSETGEPFYAYINGLKQNETAAANVKITDLTNEYVQVRIEFANQDFPSFDRNVMLTMGHEITGQLKLNKKGVYVLRPFGQPVPLTPAPSRTDDQPVIIYHEEPVVVEMEHRPAPVQHLPETVTTVTETQDNNNPGGGNVDVNIDVPGIQMNVVVTEPGLHGTNTQTHTTYTTTTTTTTTTTELPVRHPVHQEVKQPVYEEEVVHEPLVPGYNGPIGCDGYLISESSFQGAVRSISSQTFEDSKMTVAKQILSSQCLTTSQVKEIMGLLTFEASKLDWAKSAYDRTYDIGNYWMLNDAFTFSSSISELNQFVESRR